MGNRNIADNRFLDANEEPKQDLTPIEGYEISPLVSLEQAIVPIEETLYHLDSMVKTAKRNSRHPADGLDSDESAAVHLYTMQWPKPHSSLYTLFNQHLRSQERTKLTPWFLYLKLFLTALHKLPSYKGIIWRGVPEDLSNQYNDDCIWWGVSSCTKTLKATENFVGRIGKRTLFSIECINGKDIKAHSHFQLEDEIILMPGTYLLVVSKSNPAEDLHIIQLRETAPKYQTIAPPFVLPPTAVEPPSLINSPISTETEETEPSGSVALTQSLGNDFFETLQDRAFRGGGFFMITYEMLK
jgi:hypothetical protein